MQGRLSKGSEQSVRRLSKTRLILTAITIALAILWPALTRAQDDPDDPPLGDVARSLRKKNPSQEIIDNDNLTQVMDDVESHRLSRASLLYSIDGGANSFKVSVPDVSCSFSFSANAKALLSSQYVQLDLPASELPRLEGPASIAGDSLQVSLYNATDWHVSELDVVLTIVNSAEAAAEDGSAMLALSGANRSATTGESTPQKRSDTTFLYKMRAAAPPSSVTLFTAPLTVELTPGQEWHWAIVQARGYPPQQHFASGAESASLPQTLAPLQPDPLPFQESSQTLAPAAPVQPAQDSPAH
jgi:hypothetical protein